MPQLQDEDIRIIQLPEAQSLVAGMKVAVDSETDGTKQLDLKEAIDANGLPPCTVQDARKVLTVNNTGVPEWRKVEVVRGLVYEGTSINHIGMDNIILDKTYDELDAAYKDGKEIEIHFYIVDGTPTGIEDIDTAFNNDRFSPFVARMEQVQSGTGPDMQIHNNYIFSFISPMPFQFLQYGSFHQLVPYGSSAFVWSRSNSTITIHIYQYRVEANCIANAWMGLGIQFSDTGTSWEGKIHDSWEYVSKLLVYYIETHGSLNVVTSEQVTQSQLPALILPLSRYKKYDELRPDVEPFFEFKTIHSLTSYSYATIKPKVIDGVTVAYLTYETVENS